MHGQGQTGRDATRWRRFRPSAPIMLVASAVVVIAGVATHISPARVQASLPAGITLPAPVEQPGATGPALSSGEPPRSSTSTTAPEPTPPTAVPPAYPLGQPASGSVPSRASATAEVPGSAFQRAAPATTTSTVWAHSGSDGAADSGTDGSTQTVAPDYPVVTTQSTPPTTDR